MIDTTPEGEEEAEPELRPLRSAVRVAKYLTSKYPKAFPRLMQDLEVDFPALDFTSEDEEKMSLG